MGSLWHGLLPRWEWLTIVSGPMRPASVWFRPAVVNAAREAWQHGKRGQEAERMPYPTLFQAALLRRTREAYSRMLLGSHDRETAEALQRSRRRLCRVPPAALHLQEFDRQVERLEQLQRRPLGGHLVTFGRETRMNGWRGYQFVVAQIADDFADQ